MAAAAAVVAVGGGFLGWQFLNAGEVFTAGVGESRIVLLEDGSRVSMGGASSLKVRMGGSRCELELKSGETLFDVQPDAHRPFVV